MKKLFLTGCFLMLGATVLFAQKYMTRTGKIYFDATTSQSPEKIEGINNEVASIMDAKNGEIVFQVLIKSFKFERQLMEEHFNENYMESDKYPKSDFKGSITNVGDVNFTKDGAYNVKVTGKLTMHGITNEVNVPGILTVKGNTIRVKAKFSVKLQDYKIDVPSVVADKIDKNASITMECDLVQK